MGRHVENGRGQRDDVGGINRRWDLYTSVVIHGVRDGIRVLRWTVGHMKGRNVVMRVPCGCHKGAMSVITVDIERRSVVVGRGVKGRLLASQGKLPIQHGRVPVNVTGQYHMREGIPFPIRERTHVKVG